MSGKEIQKWADEAMFEAAPIEHNEGEPVQPRVTLLWATPDPLGAIAAACRMYEGKPTYDLAGISDDERVHYWEQVQRTHLKAPLEFVKLHFFIEGVTRSFTHQMVRQRTAVYAQESLRFAVKDDLAGEAGVPPGLYEAVQPDLALGVYRKALEDAEEAYKVLIDMGVPAEDARELMPHAVTTRLNYCTDLRALLDHAGNRLCTQAQFQWRFVFSGIVNAIRTHEEAEASSYWQFKHIANSDVFRPVCYSMGHCPFTADFDRGCTIRERVQAGNFDRISDSEWLLDPAAARKGG